jgi:phage tail-like protein
MNGQAAAAQYNGMVTPTLDYGAGWVSGRTQFFRVDIIGVVLGLFSKCEGLGATLAVEKREEGGTNGYAYNLPGRVTYSNIKVTRPVGVHSSAIATLFQAMNDPMAPRTATITALDSIGGPLAAWTMNNVVVVKWTGPSFNTGSAEAATETLEFAHEGFAMP